jgi:hypothetical protein
LECRLQKLYILHIGHISSVGNSRTGNLQPGGRYTEMSRSRPPLSHWSTTLVTVGAPVALLVTVEQTTTSRSYLVTRQRVPSPTHRTRENGGNVCNGALSYLETAATRGLAMGTNWAAESRPTIPLPPCQRHVGVPCPAERAGRTQVPQLICAGLYML